MRKSIWILLLLVFLLSACGGQEKPGGQSSGSQPGQTSQPAPSVAAPEVSGYVFKSGENTVAIDDDMAAVLAALGEAKSYFEAESCAFEGLDKTYTYPGFVITTRPDGEKDFVNSIVLTDDSVTTPEGVYIGSTAADVAAAYGESDDSTDTVLSYTKDNTTLNFILDGDKVISIEYLPA